MRRNGQEPPAWLHEAGRKADLLTGRTRSPEETEASLRPVLPEVPVTRVADLTPLDRLGLPVMSAVTPLARDLTTHMGKGRDAMSARVSALMEAVERVSAERAPPGTARTGSFEALRDARPPALDPRRFSLPDDTRYAPDREITWIEGYELVGRRRVRIAADLALSPPREGVLREVDTNGLAAGNTHLESVVHALCEAIERDVLAQLEFVSLFAGGDDPRPETRSIDPGTAPGAVGEWVEVIRSRGLELELHDVTGDVGVPTFVALLADYAEPARGGGQPWHFFGSGAALSAGSAALRAITEAVQSRLSYIQGARDSFNETPGGARAATRAWQLRQAAAVHRLPFPADGRKPALELREDLEELLRRLRSAGFGEVIVVDLTDPRFRIPVVRVRVPGLSPFYVNRRRVDWRCLRHLL